MREKNNNWKLVSYGTDTARRHETKSRRQRAAIEPLERRTLMTAVPSLVGSDIPFEPSGGSGPVVAMFADGGFAIGSQISLNDVDGDYQLSAQRYTSAGAVNGSPVVVDSNFASLGGVVSDGAGDLVVLDNYDNGVYLTATGAEQSHFSDQAQVGNGSAAAVAINADGKGIALVYDQNNNNKLEGMPFTLSSSGTVLTLGTEFDVSDQQSDVAPAVAVAPDGTIGVLVVVGQNALFHTYSSTGSSISSLVQIPADSPGSELPSLAVYAHGVFTGAWFASGNTANYGATQIQQYASTGALIGSARYYCNGFGGLVLATNEGALTLVQDNQGGSLVDFDLATANPSSPVSLPNNGIPYGMATNGTGSAVVVYDDLTGSGAPSYAVRRVSVPAPVESAYQTYSVGQTVEAENYNVGGEGVAYHDDNAVQQGGAYRLDSGVDVLEGSGASNDAFIGFGDAGEWVDYTVEVPTTGMYDMAITVRGPVSGSTAAAGGQFHANFNGANKTGTLTVNSTSTSFGTVTASSISLSAGTYTVRVMLDKNATGIGAALDLDAFKITASATPTPPTTSLTITPPANQSSTPGKSQSFTLGSFTASNATGPYTVDVNWGDGTADTSFSATSDGTIAAQKPRICQCR